MRWRSGYPPLPPSPLQDGVRVHTINRETGKARIWQIPFAFFANFEGNAYDTEGVERGHLNRNQTADCNLVY